MKKTKLLLATPLMLTPMVALIPSVTSCNKQTQDISLSGEFAANVNVTAISEKLEIGGEYSAILSIKEDKVGTEYLPQSLTTVKSGDVELWCLSDETNSNDLLDYYEYVPFENNTKALLYIRYVRGPISIEAKTATLSSIAAVGVDITGRKIAEFEVNETLSDDTARVAVFAVLSNEEIFMLDGGYTVQAGTYTSGHKFTEAEIVSTEQTGTVTYGSMTANFTYKIIDEVSAWIYYGTDEEEVEWIEKYTDIYNGTDGAIDVFNDDEGDAGYYDIVIFPGTYDFTSLTNNITIKEAAGKYLTLRSVDDPYYDEYTQQMEYWVEFDNTFDASDQSLITIDNTNGVSNTSVTISGIQFNNPTDGRTSGAATDVYNHILMDCEDAGAPTNVTIDKCKFYGDEDETVSKVNAVASDADTTTKLPTNLIIDGCIGQYLNTLYYGDITNDASTTQSDLIIYGVLLYDCQQFIDLDTVNADILIGRISAEVMYKKDATTGSSLDSAMDIRGSVGTSGLSLANCLFTQLVKKAGTSDSGFMNFEDSLLVTSPATHQLNLYKVGFTKAEADATLHTAYNSIATDGYDWTISYTADEEAETKTYTICSDPDTSASESNYWDIDAE